MPSASLEEPAKRSRRTRRPWKSKAATVLVSEENFFKTSKPADWRLEDLLGSAAPNSDMSSLRKPKLSEKKRRAQGIVVIPANGAELAETPAKGSASWPAARAEGEP